MKRSSDTPDNIENPEAAYRQSARRVSPGVLSGDYGVLRDGRECPDRRRGNIGRVEKKPLFRLWKGEDGGSE